MLRPWLRCLIVGWLTLGGLTVLASPPASLAETPAAAKSGVETSTAEPPTHERRWHTSLTTARAEAAKQNKLVFVDLFAEWCGWCYVLEEKVFSQPIFDELARKMVLVRLDVEDHGEGARTQARYGVTGLPTTMVLEPSGILVGKVTGMEEPATYVKNIEQKLEIHERVIGLYDQVVASEGEEVESEQMMALAEAFHKRGDGSRAAKLYGILHQRAVAAAREAEGEEGESGDGRSETATRAQLAFRLADAQRMAGDLKAAADSAATARQLANREKDTETPGLIEAIDLLGIQIATEIGDCDKRRQSMESFLKVHPESRHHRQVESSLVALETGADGTGCS